MEGNTLFTVRLAVPAFSHAHRMNFQVFIRIL